MKFVVLEELKYTKNEILEIINNLFEATKETLKNIKPTLIQEIDEEAALRKKGDEDLDNKFMGLLRDQNDEEAALRKKGDEDLDNKFMGLLRDQNDELKSLQSISGTVFKSALLDFCYPVGSIYWSGNSTNPSELFGGTWNQIKDRFIWAKGDDDSLNATGGSKTVTLSVANLPSHTHSFTPSGTVSSHFHGLNNHTHRFRPRGSVSVTSNPTFSGSLSLSDAYARAYGYFLVYQNNLPVSEDIAKQGIGFWTNELKDGNQAVRSAAGESKYDGVVLRKVNMTAPVTGTATVSRAGISGGGYSFSGIRDYTEVSNGNTTSAAPTFTGTNGTTSSVGSGTAIDKMPPYIVKYCWERVS